ncbi:MAG TPA: hypothetical protein VJ020_07220 [Anaerolineales bacterium]|nr:hypothetical protein [Anaerolineales bacterium]
MRYNPAQPHNPNDAGDKIAGTLFREPLAGAKRQVNRVISTPLR